ncbi:MAG: osmotically inducible protein C [Leptospiraceae bacterium]|nr:MAG: osmotically inducible protein C [Leptospiraceae bacterium]
MKTMQAKMIWKGNMEMESEIRGLKVTMDAKEEDGGLNKGQTPKELVLSGLCGCTGMDVIAILKKMRSLPESFTIEAEATLTEEHPKVFNNIHLKYIAKGVEKEKLEKAVKLSQEKYCGVSAMLRKTAEITYEIIVL